MDEILNEYRDKALEAIKEILEEELQDNLHSMEIKLNITPFRVVAECTKHLIKSKSWRDKDD